MKYVLIILAGIYAPPTNSPMGTSVAMAEFSDKASCDAAAAAAKNAAPTKIETVCVRQSLNQR